MTGFLRRRSRDDSDIAEYLGQLTTASYDGTTWEGASDVGLPGGDPPRPAAAAEAGPGTIPLDRVRELGYQAWHQRPAAALEAPAPGRPERARRPADAAMFTRTKDGPGLECGLCRWRRHADPAVQDAPYIFDALRASAASVTPVPWRPDAVGRWVCPDCQKSPLYWPRCAPRHSAPRVRQAKMDGQYVPPDVELDLEVVAEQAALERLHASRNRTAMIIRPDGRFLTARIVTGDKDYQGKRRAGAR
jgi:hypothetical protein